MRILLDESNYKNHIEYLLNDSIHFTSINYDETSSILILQTCTFDNNKSYYILSAIEIQSN